MFLLEILLVFGTFGLMGEIGDAFYAFNFKIFGIFSYLYPLGIIYLAYLHYKKQMPKIRYLELWLSSIFCLLMLLILQASALNLGVFGQAVIDFLLPYLGLFGVWVLSLFGIGICLLSFSEKDIIELIKDIPFASITQHLKTFSLQSFALIKQGTYKLVSTLKAKTITSASPVIELTLPQETNLLDLKESNDSLKENKTSDAKLLPKQEFKQGSIDIQEFVIPFKQQEEEITIRVLDEMTPKEENPFLKNPPHLPPSDSISTSAELLKKIRQSTSSSYTQHISTPQNTPTSKPTTKQHESLTQQEEIPQITPQKQELVTTQDEIIDPIPQPIHKEETMHLMQKDIQETMKKIKIQSKPIQSPKSRITQIKILKENEALLKEIDQGQVEIPKDYKLPPLSLLAPAPNQELEIDEAEIDSKIENLISKLSMFKINGDITCTYSGPVITTFEYSPAPNVKISRIQSLENDIAMALEAKSIRIQAPIPGKNVVGIEIPNSSVQTIYLREIFESEIFKNSTSPLTLALGKDVVGNPFITDLKKLPHLLIAGTTGSGKSVGVNAMILSLLYRNSPDDLKLMMIDPKMVEFMPYSDLPHLITPIIIDPKKAVIGLANAVKEMERRYGLMSQSRTKEIVSYNQKAEEMGFEKFPYFVIIIDELADLMMTAGKEVEYSMARIAQMGRASGIHLIVATQSPRAEVLTGLIKTNLPAHLSYKVGTKIDAGIIGCAGAETLLGRGDLLFTPPGMSGLVRLHAPWSSEEEVNAIIAYIKEQREANYDSSFLPEEKEALGAVDCDEIDEKTAELIERAKQIMLQDQKTSISYLQRKLGIGYNKSATIIEKLEEMGFLSEPDAKGNRQIL